MNYPSSVYSTPHIPQLLTSKSAPIKQDNNHDKNDKKRDVSSCIKVVIRMRPPFKNEIDDITEYKSIVAMNQGLQKLTIFEPGKSFFRSFNFDKIFGPKASQEEIYEFIGLPIIQNVLKGINGTIMAYGQTGTGKTYTMGILSAFEDNNMGLVPRCLNDIFSHITEQQKNNENNGNNTNWTCKLSFMQIYMEMIQDLLNPSSNNLMVRESFKDGTIVPGLKEFKVQSASEAYDFVMKGLKNRRMAPTLMNTTSSRAHTILCLEVIQRSGSTTINSKLRLVDLAGSERVNRTQSTGSRLSEAKIINKSLSVLGNVISGLAKKYEQTRTGERDSSHIPYRDSKLTRMLKDVLLGNSNIYVIATVSPARQSHFETLSTLMFAQRCMKVETHAYINEKTDSIDYKSLAHELQAQLLTMQSQSDIAASTPMKEFIKYQQRMNNNSFDEGDNELAWSLVNAIHDTLWEIQQVSQFGIQTASERILDIYAKQRADLKVDESDDKALTKVVEDIESKFPLKMISFEHKTDKEMHHLKKRGLSQCGNLEEFVHEIAKLHRNIVGYLVCITKNLEIRDYQVNEVKMELITHLVDHIVKEREYDSLIQSLNDVLRENTELKKQIETDGRKSPETCSTSLSEDTRNVSTFASSIDTAILYSKCACIIQKAWRSYARRVKKSIKNVTPTAGITEEKVAESTHQIRRLSKAIPITNSVSKKMTLIIDDSDEDSEEDGQVDSSNVTQLDLYNLRLIDK